jgi:hypothetical protein
LDDPDRPAQFVSYDPQGIETRPADEYLVGTDFCGYAEKSSLPKRMFDYALHNNLEFIGPAYTVNLFDAASVTEANQFLLQVAVQARPA